VIPRRRAIHLEPPVVLPDMLADSYGTPAPASRAERCLWPACRCDCEDTGCPAEQRKPLRMENL
jgi:hypothetical protein